jgi:hypothetical protein
MLKAIWAVIIFAIEAGGMRRSASFEYRMAPDDRSFRNATGAAVSNGGAAALAGSEADPRKTQQNNALRFID